MPTAIYKCGIKSVKSVGMGEVCVKSGKRKIQCNTLIKYNKIMSEVKCG